MGSTAGFPNDEVEANGRTLVAVRQLLRPRAEDAIEDERRRLHELQRLRRLLEALSLKKLKMNSPNIYREPVGVTAETEDY